MKILLTGATGFLGKRVHSQLIEKGYDVYTFGRSNTLDDRNIYGDLTNDIIYKFDYYDAIVHVAGKAHLVPKNEMDEIDFLNVNVNGTKNLLNSIQSHLKPRFFIYISSVSVYGLNEANLVDEQTPTLATDAYGKSKLEAEKIIQKWCLENGVIWTIFRLPLVAGLNPPGNLGSMISAIRKGYYFNIDGGKAKKSIVLADDVANIVAIAFGSEGIYNLTDGQHLSFKELSFLISKQLGKKKPKSIPFFLARFISVIGDFLGEKAPINSYRFKKIVSELTFDDTQARQKLGWNPGRVIDSIIVN